MDRMNDFEVRYNAMEAAKLFMIQRLLMEIAELKGEQASTWIDQFRNAVTTEISDVKRPVPSPDDPAVSQMARDIVTNVAKMAKERLEEYRGR